MMAPEPQTITTQKTSHSVGVNVTAKTETTPVVNNLEINHQYFYKRNSGILKLIQLLFGIICIGCGSRAIIHYAHFFMFVVVIFFILTLLLSLIYLLTLQRLMPQVPWTVVELGIDGAAVILYFIASITMLTMTTRYDIAYQLKFYRYYDAYVAAGVFGLFNLVAYICSTYLHYLEFKASKPSATSPAPNGNAA